MTKHPSYNNADLATDSGQSPQEELADKYGGREPHGYSITLSQWLSD